MARLFIGILILAISGTASAQVIEEQGKGPDLAQPPPDEVQVQERERGDQAGHLDLVWNESVERYLNYFSGPAKWTFQKWLDNSARSLPLMQSIFREENLPEELVYVAMIESGFSPGAMSRAKAVGPWQLMPETARSYGLRSDIWRDERKDPVKSTRVAALILKDLYDRLESWPLVLAAYNAGIGRVRRALAMTGTDDFWDLKKTSHLKRESNNFVPKFMAAARIAKDPGLYGFRVRSAGAPRNDRVVLGESADLAVIASWTGSSYKTLKALNPELNGRFTPPDDPLYVVNIPKGTKRMYQARSVALARTALRSGFGESFLPLVIRNAPDRAADSTGTACQLTGPVQEPLPHPEETTPTAVVAIDTPAASRQKRGAIGPVLALCVLR